MEYIIIALLANYIFVKDYLNEGEDIEFAVFFLLVKLVLFLYITNCTNIEPFWTMIINLTIGLMVGKYIAVIEEVNEETTKTDEIS